MRRIVVLLLGCALLAACGQTAPLRPKPGNSLPVAPVGRDTQPNAKELLQVPTQAAPERNVELRSRSEDRKDDPFDLPPSD